MKVNKIRFVDKSLRVKFPMFKFVHCFKSRFNAKCDRRTIVLLQLLDKVKICQEPLPLSDSSGCLRSTGLYTQNLLIQALRWREGSGPGQWE